MFSKKKTASKKKSGLSKLFKSKKALAVSLGVCLAVVASAYVATAKFSANPAKTYTITVKALKSDSTPIKGAKISLSFHPKAFGANLRDRSMTTNSNGIAVYKMTKCPKSDEICLSGRQMDWVNIFMDGKSGRAGKDRIENLAPKDYNVTFKVAKEYDNQFKSGQSETSWKKTGKQVSLTAKVVERDGKTQAAEQEVEALHWDIYIAGKKYANSNLFTTSSIGTKNIYSQKFDICTNGTKEKVCLDTNLPVDKIYPTAWKANERVSESKKSFPGTMNKNGSITIKLTTSSGNLADKSLVSKVKNAITKNNSSSVAKDKSYSDMGFDLSKINEKTKTISITLKDKSIADGTTVTVKRERKKCFQAGENKDKPNGAGGCVPFKTNDYIYRSDEATVKGGKVEIKVGTVNIPVKVLGRVKDRLFWFDSGNPSIIIKNITIIDKKTNKTIGSQKGLNF